MKTYSSPADLLSAFGAQRALLAGVIVFGVFVNLLVLTGPIFALQVYDRVLTSRSYETLVALSILTVFLFVMMGILDYLRKRLAARIGERLVSMVEKQVFDSVRLRRTAPEQNDLTAFSDLEALRHFLGAPLFMAMLDLPWVPVFVLGIALFHPALGWLCAIGAMLLVLPGLWNLVISGEGPAARFSQHKKSDLWAHLLLSHPDMTYGIDLKSTALNQWRSLRLSARRSALKVQDHRAGTASVAQTLRLLLQSAVIAMGAYLVLKEQLTAGAIIATTVLLGRVMGPLEQLSQNSRTLKSQLATWRRLSALVRATPKTVVPGISVVPGKGLHLDQITVFPPGASRAALRMVGFELQSGQALGVIGPTAAGKSTLARAIVGIWPVAGGHVRHGDISIDQLSSDNLHRHIGYLPQQLRLLEGTIAENISGLCLNPDEQEIIIAARNVDAHGIILGLSDGYETRVGPLSTDLPGGLVQRIGLARANFADPDLLVLDEPSNNLDSDGMRAVNGLVLSMKRAGKSVVILSQRPAALVGCDKILVLDRGAVSDFGPADQIMDKFSQNSAPLHFVSRQRSAN